MKFECEKVVVEVVYRNGRRVKRVHVKDPVNTRRIPCKKIDECKVCVVEPTVEQLEKEGWKRG